MSLKKMVACKSYTKIGLTVSALSLLFQLLGFTCPGWIFVSTDLSVLGITSGLMVRGFGEVVTESAVWYTRVCVHGDTYPTSGLCSASTGHDDWEMGLMLNPALSDLRDISWLQVQVLLTSALLFCIICTVVCVIKLCDVITVGDRTMYGAAAVTILLSGIGVLPPVFSVGLSFGGAQAKAQTLYASSGQRFIDVKVPWALILSAVGALLALVSFFVFVVAAVKVKKEEFVSSIFPSSYLSPAILKIGNFPANISISDRMGHMPPSLRTTGNTLGPPPIGTRDQETFSFRNMGLDREDTFEPYVMFPPKKGQANGLMRPLGATSPETSEPPPYHRFSSQDSMEPRLPGSIAFYKDAKDTKDDKQTPKLPPWLSPRALPKASPRPTPSQETLQITSRKKRNLSGERAQDQTTQHLSIPGQATPNGSTNAQTNKPHRSASFKGQNKVSPATIRKVASADTMKPEDTKVATKPGPSTANKNLGISSKAFAPKPTTANDTKKDEKSANSTTKTSQTATTKMATEKNETTTVTKNCGKSVSANNKNSASRSSSSTTINGNICTNNSDSTHEQAVAKSNKDMLPERKSDSGPETQTKATPIPTVKLDNTYCTYK